MHSNPLLAATLGVLLSTLASVPLARTGQLGQSGQATDPLDPSASVLRVPATDLSARYQPLPDLGPLPWPGLFDEQARFIADPAQSVATRALESGGTGAHPGSMAQAAPATDAAHADAMATVLRIDRDTGRVRLKHGPIESIGMPAMTMLFRVADPTLLDAVVVGETVGIRVEQRDQTFYVTAWVKGVRP